MTILLLVFHFALSHWTWFLGGGVLTGGILALVVTNPAILAAVPRWVWEVLICVLLLVAYGEHERAAGEQTVQTKWDAEKAATALAAQKAVAQRVADNTQLKSKQTTISNTIQGIYDDEVKNFTTSIAAGQRVRVGAGICPSLARQTDSNGAGGGNGADTTSGLVSAGTQQDIDALKLRVEKAFAAGRAAQTFILDNGMAPPAQP